MYMVLWILWTLNPFRFCGPWIITCKEESVAVAVVIKEVK